jgi:hypothetical protein
MEVCVFSRLTGGIGNRLFQFYAASQYSQIHNVPVKIVKSINSPAHGSMEDFINLFPEITLCENEPESYSTILQEKKANSNVYTFIDFEKLETPLTSVKLLGTWQSYKFCENVNLVANWQNALKNHDIFDKCKPDTNMWMIHFRHGDYKNLPHHQIPLIKYYTKCIYEIPAGSHIRAFSDEPELSIEFLESVIEGRNITVSWSNEKNDVATLYEMSNCLGGLITSNSTFSWWGAYYAKMRADEINHKMNVYYPSQYLTNIPGSSALIPKWGTSVLLY